MKTRVTEAELDEIMSEKEKQAWAELVVLLSEKGVKPSQARRVVMREMSKKEEGAEESDSIFSWAGVKGVANTEVKWVHVLIVGVGALSVYAILKALATYYEFNIPLIHDATADRLSLSA